MTIYAYGFFMVGAIVLQGFYGFHVDFDLKGVLLALSVGVIGGVAQILYNISLRTISYDL